MTREMDRQTSALRVNLTLPVADISAAPSKKVGKKINSLKQRDKSPVLQGLQVSCGEIQFLSTLYLTVSRLPWTPDILLERREHKRW